VSDGRSPEIGRPGHVQDLRLQKQKEEEETQKEEMIGRYLFGEP
jgi:hypothetical protein